MNEPTYTRSPTPDQRAILALTETVAYLRELVAGQKMQLDAAHNVELQNHLITTSDQLRARVAELEGDAKDHAEGLTICYVKGMHSRDDEVRELLADNAKLRGLLDSSESLLVMIEHGMDFDHDDASRLLSKITAALAATACPKGEGE